MKISAYTVSRFQSRGSRLSAIVIYCDYMVHMVSLSNDVAMWRLYAPLFPPTYLPLFLALMQAAGVNGPFGQTLSYSTR